MTNKLEIANKFKAFFTNIGNHLANNIKYKGFHNHSYYLNKKVIYVFTFNKIEEYTVKRIINNLPNKNSCGFDDFSPNLLKLIEPVITKSLTLLNPDPDPICLFTLIYTMFTYNHKHLYYVKL